jgi:hypothetical protein
MSQDVKRSAGRVAAAKRLVPKAGRFYFRDNDTGEWEVL